MNCSSCQQRPAQHTIGYPVAGKTDRLCCICYVKAGHPPADWHRECLETERALKATVKAL